MILWIVIAVVVVVFLWAIAAFNSLTRKNTEVKTAWSDIDVQLKRRYDLIPNLVNTVKGYATHESSVFENITKARSAAMGAGSLAEKGQAEATLAASLKSVFAIAEAYPDLKANQNFLSLQTELTDTEDKIEASRRFYNANVLDLNTAVQTFPGNFIANSFHFTSMEFYQLEGSDMAAKDPVTVKF